MAKFRMKRIPVPDWAQRPDTRLDDMRLADYDAIQEHRGEMLAVVHQEIESYLNTPGLYFESDEEGFPNRARLTSEYYIGDESYIAHHDPVWFQIGIMCRCLEIPRVAGQEGSDYLGLEVWLRTVPTSWSFQVLRNTDSSVI